MERNELQRKVFDRIEELIEDVPADGIAADGTFSDTVQLEQLKYIQGMRSARLAAINVLKTPEGEDGV